MATRKGQFMTGVIGPVVLRVVNEKQVVSSKVGKGKIKHSEETKKSNQTFGMASSLAAQFRQSVGSQLNGLSDFDMNSRLSGTFFSILSRTRNKATREYHFLPDSFQSLEGFNFHQSYRLSKRLAAMPELSLENNVLKVAFPQINEEGYLQFAYGSFKCSLTICLSLFRLQDGFKVPNALTEELVIVKQIRLESTPQYEFKVPAGCFYVLSIFLRYNSLANNGFVAANSPKLTAACICKAEIAEGEYRGGDQYRWEEMLQY
jgi:hypothetical protein